MSQPPEDDDGDGIGDLNAVQKMLGTIREVFSYRSGAYNINYPHQRELYDPGMI